MYLAPLNYDRFFKKVFSDTDIAKKFLEDFLNETITEIEQLGDKHRVTDDAAIVEFDYRCKIKGKYIIIDMQQWYKPDVVKRFYLYHSLNTGLQLETLGTKFVVDSSDVLSDKKIQKNYERVDPVYTLIWMVDDNLHYEGDYAEFSLQHQSVSNFIKDEELWFNADINEISSRRTEISEITDNKYKNINFLSENKLVFMFQKNIVSNIKNNKINEKYSRWFEFAIKTRDGNNSIEDFREYAKDTIFKEVIRRLKKDDLNEDDIEYLESEDENIRLTLDFYMRQEKQMEEQRKEGIEQGIEKERVKNAKGMLDAGLTVKQVADILKMSVDDLNNIINN